MWFAVAMRVAHCPVVAHYTIVVHCPVVAHCTVVAHFPSESLMCNEYSLSNTGYVFYRSAECSDITGDHPIIQLGRLRISVAIISFTHRLSPS